ncbi:hypothetical protein [Nocardioides pacificus]
MPDQLTDRFAAGGIASRPTGGHAGRGRAGVSALAVGGIVALYALVAAAAGWLWERWWTPPEGLVFEGTWGLRGVELPREFDGTGRYVLLAVVAGLVIGMVLALALAHHELAVLVGVLVGSCLAAYLMATVGQALGPDNPATLAREAPDLTMLPGELRLTGKSPWLAFPLGSLTGVLVVWTAFARPHRSPEQSA